MMQGISTEALFREKLSEAFKEALPDTKEISTFRVRI